MSSNKVQEVELVAVHASTRKAMDSNGEDFMVVFEFKRRAGRRLEYGEIPASGGGPAVRAWESAILDFVREAGFRIGDLRVRVWDGVVTLRGTAPDQATRESLVLTVGNLDGVEWVDDRLSVNRRGAPATLYTVVPGDTMEQIARRFYGDGKRASELVEANAPFLGFGRAPAPGIVLRVPRG